MTRLRVHYSYSGGGSLDFDPVLVADVLGPDATDDEIAEAIRKDTIESMDNGADVDIPSVEIDFDCDRLIEAVRAAIAERMEDDEP